MVESLGDMSQGYMYTRDKYYDVVHTGIHVESLMVLCVNY